jgi:hypothetical protein
MDEQGIARLSFRVLGVLRCCLFLYCVVLCCPVLSCHVFSCLVVVLCWLVLSCGCLLLSSGYLPCGCLVVVFWSSLLLFFTCIRCIPLYSSSAVFFESILTTSVVLFGF